MSDLLTHADYRAIAADLTPPRTPFIDGKYQRGGGPAFDSVNPRHGAGVGAADLGRCIRRGCGGAQGADGL